MKIARYVLMSLAFTLLPLVCTFSFAADRASESANEPTKTCFQCKGTGEMGCPEPTCKNGMEDCPGPCLKLSKGSWVHMHVDGHPPTDLWQTFYYTDGSRATMSWNQNHVGDVIQMQNGKPVNIGKCKICGGTGRVKCTVCKGTGHVLCNICEGKKVVPISWTAFDNPKMKSRPSKFTLKDGRILVGRSVMIMGDSTTIRTAKGDVEVNSKDIVTEEKQVTRK